MKLTSYLIERVLFESSRTTDFFDLYACEAMKDTLEEAKNLFRVLFDDFYELMVIVGKEVIREHTAFMAEKGRDDLIFDGSLEEVADYMALVKNVYGIRGNDPDLVAAESFLHRLVDAGESIGGFEDVFLRDGIWASLKQAAEKRVLTMSISEMRDVYEAGEELFSPAVLRAGSPRTWVKIIDAYLRMRDRKSFEAFDGFLDLQHSHGELREYLEVVGRDAGYDMRWVSRKNLDIRARGSLRELARYCSSFVRGLIRQFEEMGGR